MSISRRAEIVALLALALPVFGACGGGAEPAPAAEEARLGLRHYNLDETGLALQGYSPVSYFENGGPEEGSAEFAVTHDGVTYHVTDARQVELFEADPARYEPAHGGWCSLMLSGSGRLTAANPESFKIVDGRLLLFWAGDYKGNYIDGAKNWESKGDEAKLLAKANETWHQILAGKKRAKVVTFD